MDYPNRLVVKGETNKSIVKAVQQQLNATGCGPISVDGDFGNNTFNAVKLFQSHHVDQNGNPLTIDGKIGAITWAVLFGMNFVQTNNSPANDLLKAAVDFATTQIGVMEDPPGSNAGAQVNKYLASTGTPSGSFWCAAFVYYCFDQACTKLIRKNPLFKTASVIEHWNNTKGKIILSADAVNKPALVKPGQIFIISFGGGKGHTGIVRSVSGGIIQTIEGNSNNDGSRNGIGVFSIQRKVVSINKGFIEYK